MATINISDLRPAGSDLFSDSEGYMRDLLDSESDYLYGGVLPFALWAVGYYATVSSGACAAGAAVGAAGVVGGVIGYTIG